MLDHTIEARALTKRYGAVEAVRGISLQVRRGEVFGLLGPNGAGKTTTAEIIEGNRVPTSGSVAVLGRDPARGERALRDRVGIVLQDTALGADLTVGEILEMTARWYSRPRTPAALIDLVELDAKAETRTSDLSGGQRRRLDLALGLVGSPDVLFLDEPTTGFDPHARRAAWATIRALCTDGMTVFLTTHAMDEAQVLADRVGVMVAARSSPAVRPRSSAGATPRRPRSASACPMPSASTPCPRWRGRRSRGSPTAASS